VRSNRAFVAGFFAMASMVTGVGVHQFNQTAAEAADDCGTNSIVTSGTHGYEDITRHYNANTCGDFRAIFDHYWVKPTVQPGDRLINGVANNRGEIVADGRVVANNAASIGRHPINHSQPISIAGKTYYQTSHVGGQAFANPGGSLDVLVVLDSAGNFKYSVIKACGNPIYATPVPPPKPPVNDIQVCELATKEVITIKEDQFNPSLHSKNLDDCKEVKIQVCDLDTKTIITINEDQFDANKHSKNLEDCKEVLIQVCELSTKSIITINEDDFDTTVHSKNLEDCKDVLIQVCDLDTKTIITINEDQFDAQKHSENLEDCKAPEKLVVCELSTKKVITINEDQFDSAKHSTNLKDCESKCPIPGKEHLPVDSAMCEEPVKTPPTPPELPKTGAGDAIGAGVGLSAMGIAAYYFAASRRLF